MFKHLKFTREQAKNIVFLSDLHIFHRKDFLLNGRYNFTTSPPFNTGEEHDEWIFSEWEKHLSDKIVFDLGDQTFRDPEGEMFTRLSQLPCVEHYCLWGNHLSGSKQCYEKALWEFKSEHGLLPVNTKIEDPFANLEVYPLKYNNITFCGNDLRLWVGKQEIHLSHFPKRIWDNMSEKRRLTETGGLKGPKPSIHLSGHSHSSDLSRNISSQSGKCLDVGVENAITYDDKFWFTYDEIENIMKDKPVQVLDHHTGSENPS